MYAEIRRPAVVRCVLHAARCILYAACCVLHVVRCCMSPCDMWHLVRAALSDCSRRPRRRSRASSRWSGVSCACRASVAHTCTQACAHVGATWLTCVRKFRKGSEVHARRQHTKLSPAVGPPPVAWRVRCIRYRRGLFVCLCRTSAHSPRWHMLSVPGLRRSGSPLQVALRCVVLCVS